MDADVGTGAVAGFKELFDGGGDLVGLVKGYIAIHTDMHLDGVVISYAAGTEMVR